MDPHVNHTLDRTSYNREIKFEIITVHHNQYPNLALEKEGYCQQSDRQVGQRSSKKPLGHTVKFLMQQTCQAKGRPKIP